MTNRWNIENDGSSDFSEEIWYGQASSGIVLTVAQIGEDKPSEPEDGEFTQENFEQVLRKVSRRKPSGRA